MMFEQYLKLTATIIALGGFFYAVHLIWIYFIRPIYNALIALAAFMEAQPTLIEIAHEFKPNEGTTLRDQIDGANMRLENIEGQMEVLIQALDWDGITERRNDGDN